MGDLREKGQEARRVGSKERVKMEERKQGRKEEQREE